jgi:hypothetical protein
MPSRPRHRLRRDHRGRGRARGPHTATPCAVELPFRSLIRLAGDKGQCMMPAMILTAFGDETGTHSDSPVMMLGGYVARLGQVNSFNPLWRRGLSRTGLLYWHGTEHRDTEAGAKLAMVAHKLVRRHVCSGTSSNSTMGPRRRVPRRRPARISRNWILGTASVSASWLPSSLPQSIGRSDFVVNFLLADGAVGSTDCKRLLRDLKNQFGTQAAALISPNPRAILCQEAPASSLT